MKVSLCTTCRGRLHHLRTTLEFNAYALARDVNVEFVLVDYNSPDGLQQWIASTSWVRNLIDTGQLSYFRTESKVWNMTKAKNLAHAAASGEILVNLDADQFVTQRFVDCCRTILTPAARNIGLPRSPMSEAGRIALRAEHFFEMGGYDETIEGGWGGEDQDFKVRAAMAGLWPHILPSDGWIDHPNAERVADVLPGATPEESEQILMRRQKQFAARPSPESPLANAGRRWAAEPLYTFDGYHRDVSRGAA